MVDVLSDSRTDSVVQKLPEYFSGRMANAFILGELKAQQHPEMLVSVLCEHALQMWPNHSSSALLAELDRALADLVKECLIGWVAATNPKVRLNRSVQMF